jgi:hypothetical protein
MMKKPVLKGLFIVGLLCSSILCIAQEEGAPEQKVGMFSQLVTILKLDRLAEKIKQTFGKKKTLSNNEQKKDEIDSAHDIAANKDKSLNAAIRDVEAAIALIDSLLTKILKDSPQPVQS